MRVWISRQAGGAFALALVFSIALFVVSSATDEGGVTWSLRLARIVPLLPIAAAGAHALTLHRARRRGESNALEAVGVEPLTWHRWIGLAALLPTFGGVLALALGLDASGLFPAASSAKACRVLEASGTSLFECAQAGLRIHGAEIQLVAPLAPSARIGSQPLFAAAAVALLGLVLVALAGVALERPTRGLAAVLLLLAETVVCQAVGASVFPPAAALVVPGLGIAALLVARAWRSARQTAMARVSSTRARA